jgi:hypothetical protein
MRFKDTYVNNKKMNMKARYFMNIKQLFKRQDCPKSRLINLNGETGFMLAPLLVTEFPRNYLGLFEYNMSDFFSGGIDRTKQIGSIAYTFNAFQTTLHINSKPYTHKLLENHHCDFLEAEKIIGKKIEDKDPEFLDEYIKQDGILNIEHIMIKEKFRGKMFATLLLGFAEEDAVVHLIKKSQLSIRKSYGDCREAENFFRINKYRNVHISDTFISMEKKLH